MLQLPSKQTQICLSNRSVDYTQLRLHTCALFACAKLRDFTPLFLDQLENKKGETIGEIVITIPVRNVQTQSSSQRHM